MEQNDVVAQIMALIRAKQQPEQPPMTSTTPFPPRPAGIMPQKGGMPPGAEDLALQNALGVDPSMLGQGHPDQKWAIQNVHGTDPMAGLPPEVLEMVLQGKLSPTAERFPGMPPMPPVDKNGTYFSGRNIPITRTNLLGLGRRDQ